MSFDVDGVLADTRPLVREAYLRAGVALSNERWDEVWGRPWRAWLVDEHGGDERRAVATHSVKNSHYFELLQDAPLAVLPAYLLVSDLSRAGVDVTFITGASLLAASRVLDRIGLNAALLVRVECTLRDKIDYVRTHSAIRYHVHVDDDAELHRELRARGYPAVHYVKQTYDELRSQVWTPLF